MGECGRNLGFLSYRNNKTHEKRQLGKYRKTIMKPKKKKKKKLMLLPFRGNIIKILWHLLSVFPPSSIYVISCQLNYSTCFILFNITVQLLSRCAKTAIPLQSPPFPTQTVFIPPSFWMNIFKARHWLSWPVSQLGVPN